MEGPVRLTEVLVNNFKAFGEGRGFPIAPLTLLYGENSVGKSSILQALLLLKQSFDGRIVETTDPGPPALMTSGPWVDVGSFNNAIYNRDNSLEMRIGVGFSVWPADAEISAEEDAAEPDETIPTMHEPVFRCVVKLGFTGGTLSSCQLVTDALGTIQTSVESSWDERPCLVTDGDSHVQLWNALGVRWAKTALGPPHPVFALRGPLPGSLIGLRWKDRADLDLSTLEFVRGALADRPYPEPLRAKFFNSLAPKWARHARDIAFSFDRFLRSLTYVGPTRPAPTRAPVELASISLANLHDDQRMLDEINRWFRDARIDYQIGVEDWGVLAADGQSIPPDSRTGRFILGSRSSPLMTFAFADVGYGLGQVLAVAAQAVSQPLGGAIVLIEQPELHLHPRLQTEVGDLLLLATALGREQLIVETHSEHLLLRLGRRIRDGGLQRANLGVLWIGDLDESSGAPGRSVVTMELDRSGEVIDWPAGFFSEDITERLARPSPSRVR